MTQTQLVVGLLVASSALMLATGGCPVESPTASVLRGTWDIALDETLGVADTTIRFDLRGQVAEVATKVGEQQRSLEPTSSVTNVEDGAVDVVATFAGGQFDLIGTLDESGDVITGTVTITNDFDPDLGVIDVPTVLTRRTTQP